MFLYVIKGYNKDIKEYKKNGCICCRISGFNYRLSRVRKMNNRPVGNESV